MSEEKMKSVELWARITSSNSLSKNDDMFELMKALWDESKQEESVQVGYSLLESLDPLADASTYASTGFIVASHLTTMKRIDESQSLIIRTIAASELMAMELDIALLYWLQADNFGELKQPKEQAESLAQAILINKKEDAMIGEMLYALGSVQLELKLLELAVSNLHSAIERFESIHNPYHVARANMTLADIQLERKDAVAAMNAVNRAKALFVFQENESGLRECELAYALIMAEMGDIEGAYKAFEEIYDARTKIDLQWIPVRARFHWGELLIQMGETECGLDIVRGVEPMLKVLGEEELHEQATKLLSAPTHSVEE